MTTTERFDIRFGLLRPLLTVLGTGPRRTSMVVEDGHLVVRMGWAFRASIPVGSITGVRRDVNRPWLGIGVHGWGGRWTVNGALGPVVAVDIDPPARARIFGLRLDLRELRVSVEDPDRVVSVLGGLS